MIGQTYTNKYFGFSMQIPTNWHVMSRDDFKRMNRAAKKAVSKTGSDEGIAAVEAAEEQQPQLLGVFEFPPGTPVEFNPNIIVLAESLSGLPGIKTGKDYLWHVSKGLTSMGMSYKQRGDPIEYEIGGKTFARATFTARIMNKPVCQVFLGTVIRGYAFSFVLSSLNEDGLKHLDEQVQTVKFD